MRPEGNTLQRQHQFYGYRDLDWLNPAARGLIECLSDVVPGLLGTMFLGQMTKQRSHVSERS